jgi:hypothetical protein
MVPTVDHRPRRGHNNVSLNWWIHTSHVRNYHNQVVLVHKTNSSAETLIHVLLYCFFRDKFNALTYTATETHSYSYWCGLPRSVRHHSEPADGGTTSCLIYVLKFDQHCLRVSLYNLALRHKATPFFIGCSIEARPALSSDFRQLLILRRPLND